MIFLRTRSEGRERRPCAVDDWWQWKVRFVETDVLDFAGKEGGESAVRLVAPVTSRLRPSKGDIVFQIFVENRPQVSSQLSQYTSLL